jgi:Mn-dependent DtxR family transcriptional regulator
MNDIKDTKFIALGTAMKLFRLKVVPTLTYGMEIIWEYLTCRQLLELEKMKARCLKRVLGVSQHTLSRLVSKLAKETFFIEDPKTSLMLPKTTAYKDALRELNNKKDIWEDFYMTEVMTNRKWMETNYQL